MSWDPKVGERWICSPVGSSKKALIEITRDTGEMIHAVSISNTIWIKDCPLTFWKKATSFIFERVSESPTHIGTPGPRTSDDSSAFRELNWRDFKCQTPGYCACGIHRKDCNYHA